MARSTHSPRNLSQQKYRKESLNLKALGLFLHSKKLNLVCLWFPEGNTLAFDMITYVTCCEAACLLMNFGTFSIRGTQRLFSAQFVVGRKYCLEISKTWERLTKACWRSSSTPLTRNRGNLLTAIEYWEFCFFFTNLPPIFGGLIFQILLSR